MNGVLVLNASYEPLNVVSVRRAIVLLLKEKAELLEAAEAQIRAERIAFQRPLVIRLVMYVKIPRRLLTLPLTRRNILKRDNYTCQYCGRRPENSELTLDHIVPRSRGGGHTWENLVAACAPCNRRKGDNLPGEIGMPLQRNPYKPRYLALTLMSEAAPTAWTKYMYY